MGYAFFIISMVCNMESRGDSISVLYKREIRAASLCAIKEFK